LATDPNLRVVEVHRGNTDNLEEFIASADVVIHLAGENRPADPDRFRSGNFELTRQLVEVLRLQGRSVPLFYASTVQVELENEYGKSKLAAEDLVVEYGQLNKAPVLAIRFPGVFGKWSRPDYNSVVATFCFNIARGFPISIRDAAHPLQLAYVDDVIACIRQFVHEPTAVGIQEWAMNKTHRVSLGEIAALIQEFANARQSQLLPMLDNSFKRALYSTFVSFIPYNSLAVTPDEFCDERGSLFVLSKSESAGQIFVSTTKPGFSRGHHWHHSKVEKFTVIRGSGRLFISQLGTGALTEFALHGDLIQIVDIPPGSVHAIHNDSDQDLILLIWASEVLDPQEPDTYAHRLDPIES
jgi:UDP-2-acetamido-2,6-beta-L-arabino-hexul-4-ose reductase